MEQKQDENENLRESMVLLLFYRVRFVAAILSCCQLVSRDQTEIQRFGVSSVIACGNAWVQWVAAIEPSHQKRRYRRLHCNPLLSGFSGEKKV